MKKNIVTILAVAVVAVGCSTSQKVAKVANVTTFKNSITPAELSKHLYIIADDNMEGRNTGEPGQKRAGDYLINEYKKNGISFPKGASDFYQKVPAEFMKKGFAPKLGDSENIWAFIPGSEKPEEVLVISAHYDHVGMKNGEVFNGADDDGSGTVSVLEVSEAFGKAAKAGHRPRRSMLFMTVTGEEKGLLGSEFYVRHPVLPLENTVCDINIDMVGRTDKEHEGKGDYIYVIGSDKLSSQLRAVLEEQNKKHIGLELDFKFNVKFINRNLNKKASLKKGRFIVIYFLKN